MGPYPFSEPETRNVTKLINDSSSNIKYYLDIHSKVTQDNLVLYSWGHSASQSDYSIMNFRNSYYWGQFGDRYFGEYVQKQIWI
ncbi:MAG: hypothetical protein IPP52_08280 [Ignavibacteria bacterium]|nr:hypothetical protein [Ignavibacteria bacterium]